MYLLDSDLRGHLADYAFHYPRQPAAMHSPPLDKSARAKRSDWGTRALGAMLPRIFGKTRMEGPAR
ncbi:hypothetical protein ACLKMY_15270 [Paraburkholderia mimosarum]|uniref:hypothetical protein n=1 Tax=Paraburkholderia mimosarum TaxID=312026 RepID=UPI0039C28F14